MSCEECQQKQKRIKILQADYEFELRKTIQDKAEQKALYEISVQKQIRKWQEKYQKQKLDHEENSKKWLNKIDQHSQKCQEQIKQTQKECREKINQCKQEIESKHNIEKEKTIERYEKVIIEMKQKHQKQIKTIQSSYQNKLSSMELRFTTDIARITKEAEEKQRTLKEQLQSIILGIRSEKNAEIRANQRLQEDHKRQRNRHLSQIYDLRSKITKLEENIKELNDNLKAKQNKIEQMKSQILKINQSHMQELQLAAQQQEKLKNAWSTDIQSRIEQFYQKELQITQRYQDSVRNIEEKRTNEMELYRNNIEQIKVCIENRQSKVEDLEEIFILKAKLSKKEKQYQNLEKQIKYVQLELENKEDVFNKLFIPTVNSTHLNDNSILKRKEIKAKRPTKICSSTGRDILHALNQNNSNLPALGSVDKKYMPPRSNKIR